ncbi:permease family domain-containing protein [Ditylenchus destructor]|nr:permease family domain-containing protein [Ditylenchus destructor]
MESKQPQQLRKFYKADDDPPWPLAVLFGFQQVMVCVSALLVIPFILADEVCPGRDVNFLRVRLISSTFVSSGISTIVQTTVGMRLALLQGTAFAYVPSVHAFMTLPEYKCTATDVDFVPREDYEHKMALIQGCLLLSACVPMLIGATGLVGMLTKFIGPITVSPLILLLMISSVRLCVERIEKHWVSLIQAVTLFATILYFAEVKVPIPGIKNRRFHWYRSAIFGGYPYLIAMLFSWGFCVFLTVTNLVAPDSEARTDKNTTMMAIRDASWIRVPYPGQFGPPQFNMGLFVAFLVSALTSVFESVGDYHAIARVSDERAPPSHAINRGILAEGSGSFISGLIGPGVGLTTHTENIGVIGVTRVASRLTLVIAGVILILLGIFTKVGALLSTIPVPLVGGVLATSMAMVGGVAIANVQSVDLKCSRNMAILGFSIMIGILVPTYYERHPDITVSSIDTLDQIIKVLMNLPMFVGAFTACILDNTVPGATREQRGLRPRGAHHDLGPDGRDIYLLPKPLMKLIDKFAATEIGSRCLPLMPIIPRNKKSVRIHASPSDVSVLPRVPPEAQL